MVAGPDPTPFLLDPINEYLKEGKTAIYVRGDDMPNFPGRSLVEKHMPIQLVPYTQGISSTLLRLKVISFCLSLYRMNEWSSCYSSGLSMFL